MNQRIKNGKDKIVGTVKETTGRVLDKDGLEFKGKMQTIKADIGNKFEDVSDEIEDKVEEMAESFSDGVRKVGSKMDNMKAEVARKANGFIDQVKSK